MLFRELITEETDYPIWVGIISRGISQGHTFYFASGANRIWDIYTQAAAGVPTVTLRLEHVRRKNNGKPERQTYTILEKSFGDWTLKKHLDGHRLVMLDRTDEGVDEPLVVSQFKKLIAAGEKVFFMNRGGNITQLRHTMTGVSTSGKPAWWFFDSDNAAHRKAIVWKTGDAIDKLTLKKTKMDGGTTERWTLYDRTVHRLKESIDEPMIVRLINQRTAKKGAVKVEIAPRKGAKLIGWITHEIVPSAALNFAPDGTRIFKAVVHKLRGRTEVLWFGPDADKMFTLKKHEERSGRTYLKVVNREAD